ncbi:MAG: THUMP domain-containing protein [Candidatus Nezhaarchaeota archaeon]|nr:THUMP domain-containing protein [Candidatus Nezhaarchaeota archaeon]
MSLCHERQKAVRAFFILSGEHQLIPLAEVRAILEAEAESWKLVDEGPFYVIVEAPLEACIKAVDRSSMIMEGCLELAFSIASVEEAKEVVRGLDWSWLNGASFAVRVSSKARGHGVANSLELEKAIGAIIKEACPSAKVDLKTPDEVIRGLVVGDRLLIGIRVAEAKRRCFEERRPRRRPFFHPSALEPKLSRLYVNLSRARRGDVLLDPFSGTGSILIEASLIGCTPLGIDLDPMMVKGALANIKALKAQAHLILGDARKLVARGVDCIATDLPYGRASSTHGLKCSEILEDFLTSAVEVLKRNRYLCLGASSGIDVETSALHAGFEIVERYDIRVHKSLTRRITVLKRP